MSFFQKTILRIYILLLLKHYSEFYCIIKKCVDSLVKKDKKKGQHKGKGSGSNEPYVPRRVRTPGPNEVLGVVLANLGGGWMKVQP